MERKGSAGLQGDDVNVAAVHTTPCGAVYPVLLIIHVLLLCHLDSATDIDTLRISTLDVREIVPSWHFTNISHLPPQQVEKSPVPAVLKTAASVCGESEAPAWQAAQEGTRFPCVQLCNAHSSLCASWKSKSTNLLLRWLLFIRDHPPKGRP